MRIIFSSQDEKQALFFSNFLKTKDIDNQLDVVLNNDYGSLLYGTKTCTIWVIEEDALEPALKWLELFKKDPNDPLFKNSQEQHGLQKFLDPFEEKTPSFGFIKSDFKSKNKLEENAENPKKSDKIGFVTLYLLITCSMLFFFASITTPEVTKLPSNIPLVPVVTAPVNKTLMYDYGKAYELTDELVARFGLEKIEEPATLPIEGKKLLQKINQTALWEGFYPLIVSYFNKTDATKSRQLNAPLFEKIREGEIWRLVTPILMHGSLLHLVFNFILFVIVGKQMEKKIGSLKYLLFILLAAIFSNTIQYLISGANFIGISGVICAMIGFVFMRQKYTPWEGYQFSSVSLSSVVIFIALMFFLQLASFMIEIFFHLNVSPGIANGAHLSGLFIGLILGRLNFFKLQN